MCVDYVLEQRYVDGRIIRCVTCVILHNSFKCSKSSIISLINCHGKCIDSEEGCVLILILFLWKQLKTFITHWRDLAFLLIIALIIADYHEKETARFCEFLWQIVLLFSSVWALQGASLNIYQHGVFYVRPVQLCRLMHQERMIIKI